MTQQIVRTVDVIECLDDRIHASQDHTDLGVVVGETYPTILTKIEALVCSPEQKEAIAHTLTSPSDLNPIVLKDDIQTYYPQADLGDFRDAVDTLLDLPLTGNNLNDMRPVLTLGAIYRWDGSSWLPFIRTGTIDHTQLILQNGDINYLHMSLSELSSLISQSHTHLNKTVLDAILSLGSGIVISTAERSRIPTQDEKDALAGSVYLPSPSPSTTNRYVTSVDPRLNTVKNPYITFGLPGTGTTYQGSDISDLELALAALGTGGSVDYIDALEILPATYPLNAGVNWQGIVWTDIKPLLMEGLASRQSVFQLWPQPSGSTAFWIGSGDGLVTIRGMTFALNGTNTLGALVERDNTVFEDCTFTVFGIGGSGIKAMQINADGVNIRRCVFNGSSIVQGIEVIGDNCSIESCRFDLANTSYPALIVSGSNCQVTSCIISQGTISVGALSQDTLFDKNRMTANTVFIDAGINTRWLGGISQDYQQAYIGRTRTVGPINSHADFRGTSHSPFVAALADPYTTEIEVLEGSYNFTSPVTISSGRSLKTVRKGAVTISGANCFILNTSNRLEGFIFSITGGSGITASGVSDIEIKDCVLTMNAPDVVTDYAINASSVSDFRVTGCQFAGTRGIKLVGDARSRITHNVFSNGVYSVVTDPTTTDLHYKENTEEGSVCLLAGSRLLVHGNHFLGSLPSKLGTTGSLWIGNYPAEANNLGGIDTISLSTGDLLHPVITTGADRSSFLGTASMAFIETGTPTVVTPPFAIKALIDRTQGYTVKLAWTASVFSGDVLWEVTVVFRECGDLVSDLGTPIVKTMLSSRTYLTVKQEQEVTLTFTSSDYGYIAGVDPTHVSLMIRRLGDDITDTLPGVAYLTEAVITLARN
jgi:hypothetical protein